MLLFLAVFPSAGAYTRFEAETASLEELLIIAEQLGIDPVRDEARLRRMIFEKVDDIAQRVPASEEDQAVLLRRADQAFTLRDEERSIIIFRGNVDMLVEGDQPIDLTAALVIIDEKQRMLYAAGNIDTVLEQLIPAEALYADAVLFSLQEITSAVKGSTAVFSDDEGGRFFLTGERIVLRDQEDILIERGMVSTREDDPYFSVRASRLRILPSGDLTLAGATLYIGRIPVFYLPYLYYPSRTFLFHPVIGYDSVRGFFSQNTLYLSGSPEPEQEGEASIFQFFLDQASRETAGVKDPFSRTYKTGEGEKTEGFQRIMADMYGGTGPDPAEVFIGYEVFQRNFIGLNRFSLKSGLSFGQQRQGFEFDLPYENFGGFFDLSFQYDRNNLKFSVDLPYATQREFTRDFMNRFEYFSLDHLTQSETEWPDAYRIRQNLDWKFSSSYRKTNPSGSLVELFQIRDFSAGLNWRLEDVQGNRVFKPNVLTAPSLSYRINGTLFSVESQQPPAVQHEKMPPPGSIFSMIEDPYGSGEVQEKIEFDLPLQPDRTVPAAASKRYVPNSLKFSYTFDHTASMSFPVSEDDAAEQGRLSSRMNHVLTGKALFLDNSIDITSALRTRVHYFDRPFGDRQAADFSSSYINILHDFRTVLPTLGLTYRLNSELYYSRFLYDDPDDMNIRKLSWTPEQIKDHDIAYNYTWNMPRYDSSLAARLTLVLPPLDLSLSPRLTFTRNSWTLQGETRYTLEDNRGITASSGMLRYRYDSGNIFTQRISFNHEEDSWKGDSQLQTKFFGLSSDHKFLFGSEYPHHLIGPYTMNLKYSSASLRVVQDWVDQGASYEVTNVRFKVSQPFPDITLWKNRIRFISSAEADLSIDRVQDFSDNLSLSFTLGFRIEEFLSLTFTSRSYHRNPGKYIDDPLSLFPDIIDSFRFGDLQARRRSPFNIDAYEVKAVHYMPDWDLHASMKGTVEMVDGSLNLVNRLQVYLQWKHIPVLQFEERSEL